MDMNLHTQRHAHEGMDAVTSEVSELTTEAHSKSAHQVSIMDLRCNNNLNTLHRVPQPPPYSAKAAE